MAIGKRDDPRDEKTPADGPPPRPRDDRQRGRLVITLRDGRESPATDRAVALALEHRPTASEQHRIEGEGRDTLEADLPAGDYTLQVYARGYDVARRFVTISERETTEVTVDLERGRPYERPTLDQRLKSYGIDAGAIEPVDLNVRRGDHLVLDPRRMLDQGSAVRLDVRSIDDLKRWLGSPDEVLGHDQPRFGPLPDAKLLDGVSARGTELSQIRPEQRAALDAVAREYIHGNAATVRPYGPMIDEYLAVRFREGLAIYAILFSTVTIGPGATLEIGATSTLFLTSRLRIHQTGILSVVGTVKADIGAYEEFI